MEANNMVPDEQSISAFAVYSGNVSKTKKKKIKTKQKKILESSLNKCDKINIIRQKKMKKEKVLDSLKSKESKLHIDPKESAGATLIKSVKVLQGNIPTADGKKKKKKKGKKVSAKLDIINNDKAERELARIIDNGTSASNLNTEENAGIFKNLKDKENLNGEKQEVEENCGQIFSSNSQFNDGPSGTKPNKKVKKLRIVDPEFPSKSGGFKKPVVSTPRVSKKSTKSRKITTNIPVQSPSNVLKNVDMFLSQTDQVSSALSAEPSRSPDENQAYLQLLEQARSEAQNKSSEACGRLALEKILNPYSVDEFLQFIWEKKPIHLIGKRRNKFSPLISTEMIDAVLRDNVLYFGKHLDVTVYVDGKRETHNLEGRAHAHVIWDFYSNGCSVRLLNPQYFMNTVHTLNAALQEFFGCFVGANVYLTPPNSQGFAPHYDDIEAFILQIEGSKIWRIYPPLSKDGYLPRYSSRNLTQDEIGEPMMEVKVSAGDVLYFPRGFIHQGRTESEHSLHITLSVYQKTAWCDLLEKLLPLTLKNAASQDVEFRKGLPLGYLKSGGMAYKNSDVRKQMVNNLKKLVNRLNDFLETDAALDQMGLSYIKDALPPVLTPSEAACSVVGGGWRMRKNGILTNQTEFSMHCSIRWIRSYCFRLVEEDITLEDGTIERQTRIYHNLDNSREYHKEEPQYLILPPNMVPAALHLSEVYPRFTKISDLPGLDDDDEKLNFVGDLWDRGLIMTEKPLKVVGGPEYEADKTVVLTKEEMEVVADLEDAIPSNENDDSDSDSDRTAENCESTEMGTFMNDFIEYGDPFGDDEHDTNESNSDDEPTLLNHEIFL